MDEHIRAGQAVKLLFESAKERRFWEAVFIAAVHDSASIADAALIAEDGALVADAALVALRERTGEIDKERQSD